MGIKTALSQIESRCLWSETPYGRYPTKGGDGGDDALWLGLLSSVGYPTAFGMLMECQAAPGESKAGMFYRNPNRRSNDNDGYVHYFSRDMAMGVLLGLSIWDVAEDTKWPHAYQWMQYIDKSRPCLQKKPKWLGGGCLVRSPIYKFAPDDRSDITPSLWALIGRVWVSNGWSQTREMKAADGMDGDWGILEAQNCPLGYILHLHALEGYLKHILRQSAEYRQRMLDICFDRQPGNLFYKILKQGVATDEDVIKYLEIVDLWDGPKYNWLWLSSNIERAIYEGDACGWDLVFLGRLILKLRGEL